VRQLNGRLSQIPRCHIFLSVRICRRCTHCSSYIVCVDLWYLHQQTGLKFSGAREPPSVIENICYLSISGAPDTRIAKEFRIFTESTMLNNLLSIAKENVYQHLDFPEADPAQYISDHPGIERRSKQYQVDVWYSRTWLADSRLTRRIQPSISSLSNDSQAHLGSTLLSRLMVPDLTPHTYSIQRAISASRHSLLRCDPAPGTPLNCVYPLRITLE